MPLYEYECDTCQHRFEVIQKYADAPPACPKCGAPVHKLASSPAIQFKGSGWYITDYARAGKSDEGKSSAGRDDSNKSSESTSESSGETKAETTTETKTEKKTEKKAESAKSDSKSESKGESKPASTPSTS